MVVIVKAWFTDMTIGTAFIGLLIALLICFYGYRLFLLTIFILGAIACGFQAASLGGLFLGEQPDWVEIVIIIGGSILGGLLAIGIWFISVWLVGFAMAGIPAWLFLSDTMSDAIWPVILAVVIGAIAGTIFLWAFKIIYIVLSSLLGGFMAAGFLTHLIASLFGGSFPFPFIYFRSDGTSHVMGCWFVFYVIIGLGFFILGIIRQYADLTKLDKLRRQKEIIREEMEHMADETAPPRAAPERPEPFIDLIDLSDEIPEEDGPGQ